MTVFNVTISDITKFPADAIVNAANTTLLGGGGVDGAIHRAAGPRLLEYCRSLGGCETGLAKITPAFNITTASHIIHTPGPRFTAAKADLCDALLSMSYLNSIALAEKSGLKTLAFPSISTGIYAFPLERAASVVAKTFFQYKQQDGTLQSITMVCFDATTAKAYKEAFAKMGL